MSSWYLKTTKKYYIGFLYCSLVSKKSANFLVSLCKQKEKKLWYIIPSFFSLKETLLSQLLFLFAVSVRSKLFLTHL